MEVDGLQRGILEGDTKAVQQCLTDIFTSVYTTCDIPENAIFGPCVLSHTSLYDSIAFIALKSTDKRTAPYIFRVDTSAANGSSEGLMWLRLVQSARNKEEQNLEAYIKNGQLFYRSLGRIAKDEELLVWYGKELTQLLLLNPTPDSTKIIGSFPTYSCVECSQHFQFEFPYESHVRFRCPKRAPNKEATDEENIKDTKEQHQLKNILSMGSKYHKCNSYPNQPQKENHKPTTDFHNLARDMENRAPSLSPRNSQEKDTSLESHPKGKRKYEELGENRGRGLDTLGRVYHQDRSSLIPSKEGHMSSLQSLRTSTFYNMEEKEQLIFGSSNPAACEGKRSAFVEVKKALRVAEAEDGGTEAKGSTLAANPSNTNSPTGNKLLTVRSNNQMVSLGSAFASVSSNVGGTHEQRQERKSAFSQPVRSLTFSHTPPLQAIGQKLVVEIDSHSNSASRLYQGEPLAVKLHSTDLNANCPLTVAPKQNPFVYATTFWPKSSSSSGQLQMQLPSTLTLLPPSFTSLCLPAQNWCAKCNASFRMTSDLVYHMRSHHKKEYAMEPMVKRRREEKLKCPICNESFRERHHLSRHMTSHN
ncbi:PR domain zinc finger protein 8 isoform X2 [Ambystoma mexicanum]